MPGERFTRKADTPKRKRQWDHVYRSALSRGASKDSAVRQASGTVKRSHRRSRRKGRR